MTRDTALINELWSIVKPSIPAKERLQTADAIVELFDEYGMAEGLQHETDLDNDLKIAAGSLYGLEDEEVEDEWNS